MPEVIHSCDAGELFVGGGATISGAAEILGSAAVAGAAVLRSSLSVSGASTLSGALWVGGDTSLVGSAALSGALTVSGSAVLSNSALIQASASAAAGAVADVFAPHASFTGSLLRLRTSSAGGPGFRFIEALASGPTVFSVDGAGRITSSGTGARFAGPRLAAWLPGCLLPLFLRPAWSRRCAR